MSLPDQRTVGLGITAAAGGHDISQRIAKIDTAIYRRKRVEFEYHTMATDETATRHVDPYHLLFEGGQFYLIGHSHERGATRVFRLDRMRGKVAYATKAEHDFQRPEDFDPRGYAHQVPWQLGAPIDTAEIWFSERIAWMVERHFGGYGTVEHSDDGSLTFRSSYALPRLLIAWTLGFGEHARILGPPALVEEARERLDRVTDGHRGDPTYEIDAAGDRARAGPRRRDRRAGRRPRRSRGREEAAIRPERFARLVTLASVLIRAGRDGKRLKVADVTRDTAISEAELREDINVLNVVNFGGGTYVLYAEIHPNGEIEVDTEPYSDTFDRPARLLPIEAKALVAAIDLIGAHLPAGSLDSARDKIVAALGEDPVREGLQVTVGAGGDDSAVARIVSEAIETRHVLHLTYVDGQGDFSEREIEPYALINGREGWYVTGFDPAKDDDAPLPPGPHQGRRDHRHGLRAAARNSIRSPTSRAGRRPAPCPTRASRTCGSPPSRPAGPARSAACWPSSRTARSSSSGRSRARATSSRRSSRRPGTPSSSSPPISARRSSPPPSACSAPPRSEPPRPDRHVGRGGARLPRRGAHRHLRVARRRTAGRT